MLALGLIWNSRAMPLNLKMVLVVGLTALGAAVSMAPAFAACAALPAGAPVVSPGDLLGRFPSGGGGMVSEVRNMVATNPSSVDGIPAILASATPAQKEALGAGLGQAAGLCLTRDRNALDAINKVVLAMNNSEVTTAFQTVTGDRQTAATGGGGGGAGGGGGGGGGTGVSGSSTAGGTSPVIPTSTSSFANSGLTFSAGSAVSAGLATTRTLAGTTTTSPVSTAASPATIVSSPATTSSINR